ncbi:HlyIII-domain-containing protein [Stereum hirsutum FP-91666 SS1]|uniref:HlyIII-domain-containing protein n=1 Tax=Stereum hirsutum (strain FP-91666) TaxID=721885 RepID=UPI000440A0DD|nr:HlyIII-domain-containing protein [Stereum hirsutum FP-91666 SS1]EIM89163.1 HlyIII-domain-containing protein [Stereum hirsutum FP-91666 SS1]
MTSVRQRITQPVSTPQSDANNAVELYPKSRSNSLTLKWSEIPEWMQDNEYITSGYRRELKTFKACAWSVIGYLHNETVNIHSHLQPALLFIYFLATHHLHLFPDADTTPGYTTAGWTDYAMMTVFLASAVFCLFNSAFYHAVGAHSLAVSTRCHALDYAGIIVLTVGSFYPCIYYAFYCEPVYQVVYLSTITIAGCGAAYIVLNPTYATPSHRGARTGVFIGLGLCSVLPVSHALVAHGFGTLCREMGFGWLVGSGGLYIGGALIYANRIPERLAPGRFDLFFASHQIFHACVVLAALAHYKCVLTAFEHWHAVRGGACKVTS